MAENSIVTAEDKAARAAEELAAAGVSVTAAAVRERSGVRMATAAAAAKAWKEQEKKVGDESLEPVPEQLQARFLIALEAVWREARAVSRAEYDEARAGWETRIAAAEAETAKLVIAVEELEQHGEQLEADAAEASQRAAEEVSASRAQAAEQAQEHATELAAARTRADRAEGALEAVTAERDRLLAQIDASREKPAG